MSDLLQQLRDLAEKFRRDGEADTAGGKLANPYLLGRARELDGIIARELNESSPAVEQGERAQAFEEAAKLADSSQYHVTGEQIRALAKAKESK